MPPKKKTFIELCDLKNIPIYFKTNKKEASLCYDDVLKLLHRKTLPSKAVLHKHPTYPTKKLYYLETVENFLRNELDNPHIIDYHKLLGWNLDNKYSKQAKTIYEITKAVGKTGEWQYTIPDLKDCRVDYAFLDIKLILEVNEKYHNTKKMLPLDYHRNDLIENYGWQIETIDVDDPDFDLSDAIYNVKLLIDTLDDEVTVDKLKKEFDDYDDLEGFGEKYGVAIMNSFEKNNPFQIRLNDALGSLGIKKNTKLYKQIYLMFVNDDTDEPNCEDDNSNDEEILEQCNNDDEIPEPCDNDEKIPEPCDNDEEIPEPCDNNADNNEKPFSWADMDKDFIVKNNEIIITRQCFGEIAIKANTKEGKEISTKLHRLIEMVVQLFKILDKRRKTNIRLLNKYRLDKALERKRNMETDIRIAKLQKDYKKLNKKYIIMQNKMDLDGQYATLQKTMDTFKKKCMIVKHQLLIEHLEIQTDNDILKSNKIMSYHKHLLINQ